MMNNNKILTVSYGTFSCTLEGFDDSFGTMKAIAEYFRDLASDDRYFGAEPPQPDAEMLARIAQKEISRRVEAREHEGKIVLSALAADAALDTPQADAPQAPAYLTEGPEADAVTAQDDPADVASEDDTDDAFEDASKDDAAAQAAEADQEAEETSKDAYASQEDDTAEDAVADAEDTDVAEDSDASAQAEETETAAFDDDTEMSDLAEDTEFAAAEDDTDTVASEENADTVAFAEATDTLAFKDDTETAAFEDDTDTATFEEDENDIVPGQPDADVEAFFENAKAAPALEEDDTNNAPVPQGATGLSAGSIAAKLQRIRAVVAQKDNAEEDALYSEDEHATDHASLSDALAADDDTADHDAEAAMTTEDDASDIMADARHDIEDALDADLAADADEDADSIAETLRDIEAGADTDAEAFSDDDDYGAYDPYVSDDEVDNIAAMLAGMSPEKEAFAVKRQSDEDMADEAIFDDLSEEEEAEEETDESLFSSPASRFSNALAKARNKGSDSVSDALSDLTDETDVASVEDDIEDALDSAKLTATDELDVDIQTDTAAALDPARPRARVIKVKRVDLNAAIERGDLEEYEDEDAAEDAPLSLDDLAPAKSETSSLSAEEEDDLARELAALEADMQSENNAEDHISELLEDDHADLEDAADEITADAEDDHSDADAADDLEDVLADDDDDEDDNIPFGAARDRLPAIDGEMGDNMDRLMSEADHQMGEPESATRRDAFAHLRAAVAAKKADRSLDKDDTAQDNAYRNDLADVVRPRRPIATQGRTQRPDEDRPAPLKLVAEQRIDVDQPAPKGPVRPRRVASMQNASAADGEQSFSEFASDVGATKLPDLLEAAAAYMSFVEGREQFSRPQLMTKVRQAGPEDGFSREDTLRSFGKLLRDGKIQKLKGGRFVASQDIGFHPDERAAG